MSKVGGLQAAIVDSAPVNPGVLPPDPRQAAPLFMPLPKGPHAGSQAVPALGEDLEDEADNEEPGNAGNVSRMLAHGLEAREAKESANKAAPTLAVDPKAETEQGLAETILHYKTWCSVCAAVDPSLAKQEPARYRCKICKLLLCRPCARSPNPDHKHELIVQVQRATVPSVDPATGKVKQVPVGRVTAQAQILREKVPKGGKKFAAGGFGTSALRQISNGRHGNYSRTIGSRTTLRETQALVNSCRKHCSQVTLWTERSDPTATSGQCSVCGKCLASC